MYIHGRSYSWMAQPVSLFVPIGAIELTASVM
jgi:hypothetical protein